jgi:DivIVA domain-containing protein
MALDRLKIEKKDFPIGRRGYDVEAVDAHLAQIAEEVSELKVSSRRRSETLASSTGDQVRAIIEASESSAAEIQSQAEADAAEIRAEANEDARATRQEANSVAQGHVGRVSEATAAMLKRIATMEGELGTLLDALKTGANRLSADLHLLESGFEDVRTSASSPIAAVPPPAAEEFEEEPAAEVEAEHEDDLIDEFEDDFVEPEPPVAETDAAPADESEGARLVALNMALNGSPREETDGYLAAHFSLEDRSALLDEVYASVEG